MDIKTLLEELLYKYDPQFDLTAGSRLRTQVIDPIVLAYSADPLATDIRSFLLQKYNDAFPNDPIAAGDAISDVLITACEVFLDAYRVELNKLKVSSSVANVDSISLEDAELLASNWFVSADRGSRSVGLVKISVDRVSPLFIEESARFYTSSGLEFKPLYTRTITQQELFAAQTSDGLFSFDIFVTAVANGEQYNISAEEITSSSGLINVRAVTNPAPFSGGTSADTAHTLLTEKVPSAISERSFVTSRGIIASLSEQFDDIVKYQTIGLDDPEMKRDQVSAQSYSDSVGYGIGYFTGNTGLISILGHKDLASGDIFIKTSDGTSYTVTSMTSMGNMSASFIQGGVVYIVDIDTALAEPTSFTFTVVRKGAILLGSTLVDSSTALGGKADVYLQPNTLTEVTVPRNKTSEYTDTVVGTRYVTFGTNKVNLYPQNKEIERGGLLTLGNTDYLVLYSTSTSGEDYTVACLNVAINAADITDEWVFRKMVTVNLGKDYEVLAPKVLTNPLLADGASQTQKILLNRAVPQARSGDTLYLSDGRSFVIDSVIGNELTILVYIDESFSSISSEIRRPITSMPQPLSYVQSVSRGDVLIDNNNPLGIEVNSLDTTEEVITFGTGLVSPSFRAAYLDYRSRYGERSVISLLTNSDQQYQVYAYDIADDEDLVYKNQRLAFSRGYKKPKLSNCVVTAIADNAQVVSEDDGSKTLRNAYMTEVELFNEMFLSNTRNVFIALGDVLDNDRYVPYPLEHAKQGDILKITSGVNSGSYVIAETLHLLIPINSTRVLEAVKFENRISTVSTDAQYSPSYANTSDGDTHPVFQKISLVKIYGEFKNSAISDLEEFLRFGDAPNVSGLDDVDSPFYALSLPSLSLMFNSPLSLLDTNQLRTEILASLNRINTNIPQCTFELSEKLLATYLDILQQDAKVSYQIIKPTYSKATIYIEQGETKLQSLSASKINLDVLLAGVGSARSEYVVPEFTTFIHNVDIAVLDPSYVNYLRGQADISTWPQLNLTQEIRYDYALDDFGYYTSTSNANYYEVVETDLSVLTEPSLYDSSTLRVHEEIFPTFYTELSVNDFLFEWLPYSSDNPLTESFVYTDSDSVTHSVLLRSGEELLAELNQYLDYTRIGGGTLRALLGQYPSFIKIDGITGFLDELVVNQSIELISGTTTELISIPSFSVQLYRSNTFTPNTALPTLGLGRVRSDNATIELAQVGGAYGSIQAGSIVVYTSGSDRYVSKVSSFNSTTGILSLADPPTYSDSIVLGEGSFLYDTSVGTCHSGVGQYYTQADNLIVSRSSTVDTGLGSVAGEYVLSSADVGKRITLFGAVYTYETNLHMYGDQQLSLDTADPTTLDELRQEVFAPTRTHIGTYDIQEVQNTTAIDPYSGESVVVEQVIRLSAFTANDLATELLRSSKVRIHFIITESDVELDSENAVTGLSTVQVYEPTATDYSVVGYGIDLSDRVLVSPIQAAQNSAGFDLFSYDAVEVGETEYKVLSSFNKNNPYNLISTRLRTVENYSEVRVLGVDVTQDLRDTMMHVSNPYKLNYYIDSLDVHTQRSILDEPLLSVLPSSWINAGDSDELSISARYSTAITSVQSVLNSPRNRVLCADIQAREMLPCFIGVTLSYSGAPDEITVAVYLQEIIKESLSLGTSLNISEIIYKLRTIGVTKVDLPMSLYLCVEDLERTRHRRNISDVLQASVVYNIVGSSRLISIKPAPYTESLLGAQITVTKTSNTQTLLGNGGT